MKEIKKELKNFLISGQRADGGWDDFSGREAMILNALVLLFLPKSGDKEILEIREKAAAFLRRYKKDNWVFSDNLGFNFLILFSLAEHDSGKFDGEALAKILLILTQAEEREGGPYFSSAGGKDIDIFTNAAIAGFLNILEVDLPNLNELVEKATEKKDFSSHFSSPLLNIYLISKFYKGAARAKIAEYLLEKRDVAGGWGSIASDLLAFSALVNFGCLPDKEAEKKYFTLPANYEKLFMFAEYFKGDFFRPDSGASEILNISLHLGVISKLEELFSAPPKTATAADERAELALAEKILALAAGRFSSLSGDFQKLANEQVGDVARRNSDRQMILMPYYFRRALGKKAGFFPMILSRDWAWRTLFFGQPSLYMTISWMKKANRNIFPPPIFMRGSLPVFFARFFPAEHGFNSFFSSLMDKLDAANTWEALYCRAKVRGAIVEIPLNIPDYGDYEKAYEPASAHALGSAAMLVKLGYGLDSEEMKNLIDYFRHYLIAMQFNDDIYDWEEDLRRGQLSTAIALFLRDWRAANPAAKEIDMEKEIAEARKVFCFTTMGKASAEALRHTAAARAALDKLYFLENRAPLEKFINLTENAAQQAFLEQKKTKEFLRNFPK